MLFALACLERTAPLAKLDLRYCSVIPEGVQLGSPYPALNRPSVHLVYKAFTFGRWLRLTIQDAGINKDIFKAHSVCSASAPVSVLVYLFARK